MTTAQQATTSPSTSTSMPPPTSRLLLLQRIDRTWQDRFPAPAEAKAFLVGDPDTRTRTRNLFDLLRFWSDSRFEAAVSGEAARNLADASFYLAWMYLKMGRKWEAGNVTLNGCFLRQCFVSVV